MMVGSLRTIIHINCKHKLTFPSLKREWERLRHYVRIDRLDYFAFARNDDLFLLFTQRIKPTPSPSLTKGGENRTPPLPLSNKGGEKQIILQNLKFIIHSYFFKDFVKSLFIFQIPKTD